MSTWRAVVARCGVSKTRAALVESRTTRPYSLEQARPLRHSDHDSERMTREVHVATVIAVRGTAEERIDPELGAVSLSIGVSEPKRDVALARTTEAHDRLIAAVRELEASGALDTWSAGQLRVWSHRPWNNEGKQLPLVHQTSAEVEVVFTDLERLGEWVSRVTTGDTVSMGGIEWRLTESHATSRAGVRAAGRRRRRRGEGTGLRRRPRASAAPTPVELADTGLLTAQPVARRAAASGCSRCAPPPTWEPAPARSRSSLRRNS